MFIISFTYCIDSDEEYWIGEFKDDDLYNGTWHRNYGQEIFICKDGKYQE